MHRRRLGTLQVELGAAIALATTVAGVGVARVASQRSHLEAGLGLHRARHALHEAHERLRAGSLPTPTPDQPHTLPPRDGVSVSLRVLLDADPRWHAAGTPVELRATWRAPDGTPRVARLFTLSQER